MVRSVSWATSASRRRLTDPRHVARAVAAGMHAHQRSSLGQVIAHPRRQHDHAAGPLGQAGQGLLVDRDQHPRTGRGDDAGGRAQIRRRAGRGLAGRVAALQQVPRLGAQTGDDGGDPDHVGHVVDVEDEQPDAGQHQGERAGDGDPGDERMVAGRAGDCPLHDHGVHERGNEDAERELDGPVPQEGPQHPRRELPAGQLEDHHGDGEHQAGEGDHGLGDRGQEAAGAGRRPRNSTPGDTGPSAWSRAISPIAAPMAVTTHAAGTSQNIDRSSSRTRSRDTISTPFSADIRVGQLLSRRRKATSPSSSRIAAATGRREWRPHIHSPSCHDINCQ